MITTNITSPDLKVLNAKVEIYHDSTSTPIVCTCEDYLETFSMHRVGDPAKFFGFGVGHELKANLIDLQRVLTISKGDIIKVAYGDKNNDEWDYPYPTLYVTDCEVDEKNNTIQITANCPLYFAAAHTVNELNLVAPYTPRQVATACASVLGLIGIYIGDAHWVNDTTEYPEGANFNGDEDLRQVLNYVAEVSGNIYYIGSNDRLTFKRTSKNPVAKVNISKEDYFELNVKEPIVLKNICATTELGDNLQPNSVVTDGVIQYIKDNPFFNLRDDLSSLLIVLGSMVNGSSIYQFNCDWEGNHLLEIGDYIGLELNDGTTVVSQLLNDTVNYGGYLNQVTEWEYNQDRTETAVHSNNISEIINETYAKVDKANKEITLYVGETSGKISDIEGKIAELELTADGISQSVSNTQSQVNDLGETVGTLKNEVSTKVTAEQVEFIVTSELSEGVDKVTTASKKYTFDDEGLNVSSTNSNISTTISEDGMNIYRQGEEVLVANNDGVKAEDLHATTYLIIGNNSRLEDYENDDGEQRTACFWIGG